MHLPAPTWDDFTIMMECTPDSGHLPLCVLCGQDGGLFQNCTCTLSFTESGLFQAFRELTNSPFHINQKDQNNYIFYTFSFIELCSQLLLFEFRIRSFVTRPKFSLSLKLKFPCDRLQENPLDYVRESPLENFSLLFFSCNNHPRNLSRWH